MKIHKTEQILIEIPIDTSCIVFNDIIEGDESRMLPYKNKDFLSSIRPLVDDVIKEAGVSWKVPDYEKSRAYFYIHKDGVNLSVEVFPKSYSDLEKEAMLSIASKEEEKDGWSEYLKTMCMFDDIDEIFNQSYPVGEIGVFSLELTPEEKRILPCEINISA